MTHLLDSDGKPRKCCGYYSGGFCSRKATVLRNGKPYCTQHDPVWRAEKRKARDDAWKAAHRAAGEAAAARKAEYADRIVRCTNLDDAAILYDEIRRL